MCEAPPLSQIRMVDFARGFSSCGEFAAAAQLARLTPKKLSPPAIKNVRRSTE